MLFLYFSLFFLCLNDVCKGLLTAKQNLKVSYLVPGEVFHFVPDQKRRGFYESDIRIYCYEGNEKKITNYFQSINLQIDIENVDDFTQYEGNSPEIVNEHYEEQKSLFSFNFFTYKKTKMRLNPFNQTCMGIDTLQPYTIRLNLIRVNVGKLGVFIIAVIIFIYAANLSKNALFYYLAGILIGVCASFLILMYLAGKLLPRRSMMIGALAGGSTIAIYVLRLLWDNIQVILVSYRDYVIGYVLITGFISFVLCYRFGPPKNKRSRDLIEWSLQLFCLISIYFSSYYTEASIVIIVMLLVIYYFPRGWLKTVQSLYKKLFPPRKRYLTLEEYNEQSIVETKKALDELRTYCSSPECKQWKVMTKLKNPKRFASFIEGEEHLMDEEIFDHDNSKLETDSENSDDDEDNENIIKHTEISDDEVIDDEEISDDEELYVPTKLKYRGNSTSRNFQSNGSRNHSYNYNKSNYPLENVSSSNIKYQSRDSPYSSKIISPSSTRDSPYQMRRMTPNNSRLNLNNSKAHYRSYREYSDEER